jgi:poly(A) polymerase
MMDIHIDPLPRQKGVYIVGGCLRDHILGIPPTDVDIAVQGDPGLFARELAHKLNTRVISMGRRNHPMLRVIAKNKIFDISPLQGTCIEEDLRKRDFTINALAYETASAKTIDGVRGIQDIHERRIRQVSKTCFQADPLRLLRAFRLAAQLGFNIEKQTFKTIQDNAHLIPAAAAERIRSELFGILRARDTYAWLQKMAQSGILFKILPELAAMQGCLQNRHHVFDVFDHTIQTLRHMEIFTTRDGHALPYHRAGLKSMNEQHQLRLKLAALLHDIGKPLTRQRSTDGRVRFIGHETRGAHMVAALGNRLRFSNDEIQHAVTMVRYHLRPLFLFNARQKQTLTPRGITRFFVNTHPITPDILLLSLADTRAKKPPAHAPEAEFEQFVRELYHQYETGFKSSLDIPALITGHDLIQHLHLTPSPLFKQILARTRESQLSGQITTREEALHLAARIITSPDPLEA